jgi:hypothetical protein
MTIEAIASAVREYGEMIRLNLAGKVKEASMTLKVVDSWRMSEGELKKYKEEFEDYRNKWQRGIVHFSS